MYGVTNDHICLWLVYKKYAKCVLQGSIIGMIEIIWYLENAMKGENEGWIWFTLEDSIEVEVKEIMYGVIEWIRDYGNTEIKHLIAYRRGI